MLPSDSTFRLDYLNLLAGKIGEASVSHLAIKFNSKAAKYGYENLQRADKKLRKTH